MRRGALVLALALAAGGSTAAAQVEYRTDRFTTSDGLPQNTISGIAQTPDGYLWFATFDGLARYDGVTFTVFDRGNTPAMKQTLFLALEVDGAGTLWAGTSTGILRYRDGELSWLDTPGTPAGLAHPASGRSYPGFVETAPPPRPDAPAEFASYHYAGEDRAGNHWLHNHNEMVRWNTRGVTRHPAARLVESGTIRVAFCDREGTVWVGTNDKGLFRIRRRFLATHSVEEGLLQRVLYPVFEDRAENIWLASGRVVTRLGSGGIAAFALARAGRGWRLAPVRTVEQATALGGAAVGAIAQDRAGRLWLGTSELLAAVRNDRITETVAVNGYVSAILEDGAGDLWAGTQFGLTRKRGAALRVFGAADGVPPLGITVMLEDAHGRLWVGTRGGLARREGERFVAEPALAGEHVRSLLADTNGVLWVGTFDHGIRRIEDGRVTAYTTRDGLYSNGAFQILEDARGEFWVSGNQGIYRVRRRQLEEFARGELAAVNSVGYGAPDGMRSAEANGGRQPAGVRARDGTLWFPTQDGVVIIDPGAIEPNTQPPLIVLERVVVDGTPQAVGSAVRLRPGQTDLEIGYTAPSSIQARYVHFRYRLLGLGSDNWIDAGTRREVHYSHLPPGNYTFQLIAANSDGVWNSTGVSLAVRIDPRFYQTAWFLALSALLFLAMVAGGVTWRVRILKAQERRLTSMVSERTAELREVNLRLEQLASEDGLTGLANHRKLVEFLQAEWQRVRRSRTPLSLLMLDVDYFKAYNDAHGHPAGDACLQQMALALGAAVRRGTDLAARYGGEEFAVVLPGTDAEGAHIMAESIRARVEALAMMHLASPIGHVTASVGVATTTANDLLSPADLISAADRALYRAKSEGRNRVVVG